jgi:hypothetical protein
LKSAFLCARSTISEKRKNGTPRTSGISAKNSQPQIQLASDDSLRNSAQRAVEDLDAQILVGAGETL